MAGVPAGHRVACHWAEEIAAGEMQRHEVAPELVPEGFSGGGPVIPYPPPDAYSTP